MPHNKILKPIPGYENEYSITDDGDVFSHPKGGNVNLKGKWLAKTVDCKGYETVTFTRNHSRKTYKVHRLVALTFLEKTGEQINHIDGVKTNNRVSNLEWCNNRTNTIHAYKNGLRKLRHSKSKIYELLSYGNSQGQVAKILDIDQSTISRIVNGKARRYAE